MVLDLPFYRHTSPTRTQPTPITLHDAAARSKQPHFYSIHVEVENVCQFLNRKSFYFLQYEQLPVLLRQFLEHTLEDLFRLCALIRSLGWPARRRTRVE